ncbi:TonB-dependent receptor domain-containing protein [Amphritea sp.]|uniref:TonB-dependent receptor domain-containing protein n=1 Tax=Amphritea sp. TaxID=1872502 RepID=UPI003A903488
MLRSEKYYSLYLSTCLALLATQAVAEESVVLEAMVVTASRHETVIQEAPASISVMDKEDLRLKNADDLAEALTSEAGITITSVGQTRRGISIRGMPVEHTLYLIDGRRISSSNSVIAHSDFELNWLPAAAIERVEVVRGPMSSLYGADALGGVVNIITRIPKDELQGEITSTFSSLDESGGDTRKASIYLSGPLIEDKLLFSLVGEVFDRDNLASSDNENISDVEGKESKQGQAKVEWLLDDYQQLTLSYATEHDETSLESESSSVAYTSENEIDKEQYGLSYSGEWFWGDVKLNAYQSNLKRTNTRSDTTDPVPPQEINDAVIDGQISKFIGDDHFVTLGGQLREETLYEERISTGKASAEHRNVFLQDEWQLFEPLMLVAGASLDSHEVYGSEISPRIYAVYKLNDRVSFKGGYGQGFRAPSLTELSSDYQVLAAGGRFWVEGNPDLEPERSKTYEGGVEYHDADWVMSAKVFENQLENLVQTVCYINCNIRGSERRRYENTDESRIRGVELSFDHDLTQHLSLTLNYTYLETEDLSTGLPLEDRPKHLGNLSLGWAPVASTRLRWRSEYVGKQYSGVEGYAPAYHLHHLDFSYQLDKHLTFFSGVDNIFDQRLEDKSELYSATEPGREIRIGISAAF